MVYDGKLQGLFSGETIEIQKAPVKKILYFSGFVAFSAGIDAEVGGTYRTQCLESGVTDALESSTVGGESVLLEARLEARVAGYLFRGATPAGRHRFWERRAPALDVRKIYESAKVFDK